MAARPRSSPYTLFSIPRESEFCSSARASSPPSSCPPVEVLPIEVSPNGKFSTESIDFDGFSLLKGRTNAEDIFGIPNSDLVPGIYEGGLKLWEGSLDLVRVLHSEVQSGHLSFSGKCVLELGCGHGLPGIYACLEGATVVHFQDFNAEVLRCLTIPNANINLSEKVHSNLSDKYTSRVAELRFFAGDWSQIEHCLPHKYVNKKDAECTSGWSSIICYDIILMAETIYSISSQQNLYALIKKCMSHDGVLYMSAKKHYFGVGGGTRQFLSFVKNDGVMNASLVDKVADGASNVRETWKLWIK